MKPLTLVSLRQMKQAGEKIACLTAYDYSFASLLDRNGVDLVMVGDSLGMVVQGHDSTLPVSVEDMVYHSRCVARGVRRAVIVTDMPFMSYQISPAQAFENAAHFLQAGAQAVKLEGGEPMVETVRFLTERGVAVCAHLGLTPQSVHQLGGYRVQGRDAAGAEGMRRAAHALQDAGASLVVLEAIPAALARTITGELAIPTIGIGSGADCDGQVLVLHDMLGLYPRPSPKFSKNFLSGADDVEAAIKTYTADVKHGRFPGPEHSIV